MPIWNDKQQAYLWRDPLLLPLLEIHTKVVEIACSQGNCSEWVKYPTPIKYNDCSPIRNTYIFAIYVIRAILFIYMEWEIEFYQDSQGNIPVQEFILAQSAKAQAKLLRFIDMLQDFGMSLGQPHVKKLRDSDVWELRIHHSSNYYRILYFAFTGQKFVLLHAFLKKTEETPKGEIETAQDRLNDYKHRYSL